MGAALTGAIRTALATAAWAAVHSVLASHEAKALAERFLGTRTRNGLYRPAYNLVAVVTFGVLVRYVLRQPGRTLYHVRGTAAAAMRTGQAASLAYTLWGVLQVGVGGLSGVPGLLKWLTGSRQVPREPEGQTPAPGRALTGSRFGPGSPFAITRQALNVFLLPLLWLNPRMTSRLAAFNCVTTVYNYLGSIHSERRLRRTYGFAYDAAYAGQGVPMFVPGLKAAGRPVPRSPVSKLVDRKLAPSTYYS